MSYYLKITSNGSKWAGEQPDSLAELFAMLMTHPLDRSFEPEQFGGFIYEPRNWTRCYVGPDAYVDNGPMFPEHPGTIRFWGNFFSWSHVFQVDTNNPVLIERLTRAIRLNQQRPDYLAQTVPT